MGYLVLLYAEPAQQEAAEDDQEQGGCLHLKTEKERGEERGPGERPGVWGGGISHWAYI